jgi:acetyl-CoA carboxylase carboxyl transferase subunit alpha
MTPPARHYLDFERPIADLEQKIDELSKIAEGSRSVAIGAELHALRNRAEVLRTDLYADLDPWRKTQVARHPARPHFSDYVGALVDDFVELRGDRKFADDQAVVGGTGTFRGRPVVVMGQEKGADTASRLRHNFGMARPEGYRKAVRLMELAERFGLAVISFVDTAGAYPGLGAEERGQAEAIARSTERGLTLGSPSVAVVTGEGGSGGAIALASASRVLILEHSIYSVISPEGAASILFRDGARAREAAAAMKITAEDLLAMKIVDRIVAEPLGGAHTDPAATIAAVGDAVEQELRALDGLGPDAVRRHRAERFYAIGR